MASAEGIADRNWTMGVLFDDGRCLACEPAVRVSLWPVLPESVGRVPVGLSPAGLGRSARRCIVVDTITGN